jgi:hypothetical protein
MINTSQLISSARLAWRYQRHEAREEHKDLLTADNALCSQCLSGFVRRHFEGATAARDETGLLTAGCSRFKVRAVTAARRREREFVYANKLVSTKYSIFIRRSALRELRKIPAEPARRIEDAIEVNHDQIKCEKPPCKSW